MMYQAGLILGLKTIEFLFQIPIHIFVNFRKEETLNFSFIIRRLQIRGSVKIHINIKYLNPINDFTNLYNFSFIEISEIGLKPVLLLLRFKLRQKLLSYLSILQFHYLPNLHEYYSQEVQTSIKDIVFPSSPRLLQLNFSKARL